MTDLAGWFAAQLDADEQTARACIGDDLAAWWHACGCTVMDEDGAEVVEPGQIGPTEAEAAHIARHDPAFVLADITAKRRILAEHATQVVPVLKVHGKPIMSGPECRVCADWEEGDFDGPPNAPAPCQTVRLLAAPYASRPGYDPSWAPDQPAHNTTGDAT